jgi:hypothetical protein
MKNIVPLPCAETWRAAPIVDQNRFENPGLDVEDDMAGGGLCLLGVLLAVDGPSRTQNTQNQRSNDALMAQWVQTLVGDLFAGPQSLSIHCALGPVEGQHLSAVRWAGAPATQEPLLVLVSACDSEQGSTDDEAVPSIEVTPLQLRALIATQILFGLVHGIWIGPAAAAAEPSVPA